MKDIKILGTGCQKCIQLEKATMEVVKEYKLEAKVSKVEDIMEIMSYGIMSTPAIVIDGKVVAKGRVPSANEIKELIINN